MSRNFLFFVLCLISAAFAFVFYSSMPAIIGLVITDSLPASLIRMMRNSDLIAFASFMSLFGLIFVAIYILIPVSYVAYHIMLAKNIVTELPLVTNPIRRTDRKSFLSNFKGLGFIENIAVAYGSYLIQGPAEEVDAEKLKNIRLFNKPAIKGRDKKVTISPVKALAPAEKFFNQQSLVIDNLLLDFFTLFARILIGVAVICVGISLVAYLLQEPQSPSALSVLQLGGIAALICISSAVIIAGLTRLTSLLLFQNSQSIARMINGLFYQNDWQQDLSKISTQADSDSDMKELESLLRNSLDKPLKEISRAVKALSVEQESKLDEILSKTLTSYVGRMEKESAANISKLNDAVNETTNSAIKMRKSLSDSHNIFIEQMGKQSDDIVKHLSAMQKVLTNSEKASHKSSEKVISTLASEVKTVFDKFSKFIESNLKKIDDKQDKIDQSVSDKDSILKDLHTSSKDLGTISNASGILLEKFTLLSSELDMVLKNIQNQAIGNNSISSGKRDDLKLAMLELQKSNRDKIGKLPEM